MTATRQQRRYDHRLIRLVQDTGDASIATGLGIPRSTAASWLKRPPIEVVSASGPDDDLATLRLRVARLEARIAWLAALLRVLLAVFRVLRPDLARVRIPDGQDKLRLIRAIDRSRGVLRTGRALRMIGLSPSRLTAWRRRAAGCDLDDQSSCPSDSPQRLTLDEVAAIRTMVTAPEFSHVPTSRLSTLAQRMASVFACASTWCGLAKERSWRRPRLRVHPEGPREGVRATRPDQIWHIDTSVLRLLDGVRIYLHAVIDNYSRRILAWRVNERFDTGASEDILLEAAAGMVGEGKPMLFADGGVENKNGKVDALIGRGLLDRVIALIDVIPSNSMIEAWWRSLKHNWLFKNQLDSAATVRRLAAFYVGQHNTTIPHSAFKGQTPDEMYFGTGAAVPDALQAARVRARQERLAENRAKRCGVCA